MPYITKEQRLALDGYLNHFPIVGMTQGELNYFITSICHFWLRNNGGVSYTNMNNLHGMLFSVSQELYRQITAPYEDEKKLQNGPVSTLDL